MSAADPWTSLVSSVRRYRAPDARFFKPVCLIAAIDLADEGSLDPEAVVADAVIHRSRTYVSLVFPSRAELGWRPLWHLSNDGLWTFYAGDHALTPDNFGSERKPGTKAIVTTNLPFSEWSQVIPNPRLCKALIDRLTDRAHIITTGTDSYRFRGTTAQRKAAKQ